MASTTAAISGVLSIASLYNVCVRSFRQLCDSLDDSDGEFGDQITTAGLQDELGRFRVWAGNVGAHRSGRLSLDHKLRESLQIHSKVSELLQDLDESLQTSKSLPGCASPDLRRLADENSVAITIISHERIPSDELSSSDSSVSSLDDEESAGVEEVESDLTTELQERFKEVGHVITCLYRFSISIRSPAQRDRLEKCASIDVSHYEFYDIQHASNKFPGVEQFLLDRLGKANSRRRQLLIYHQKHHHKITRYIDLPVDVNMGPHSDVGKLEHIEKQDFTGVDENQGLQNRLLNLGDGTIATTMNTQTTVSTFVLGPGRELDTNSDDGRSQTSYATSSGDDTRSTLRVPPPPEAASALDGEPFQCPYCYTIIGINGSRAWM